MKRRHEQNAGRLKLIAKLAALRKREEFDELAARQRDENEPDDASEDHRGDYRPD
jgi:hypothetical protein